MNITIAPDHLESLPAKGYAVGLVLNDHDEVGHANLPTLATRLMASIDHKDLYGLVIVQTGERQAGYAVANRKDAAVRFATAMTSANPRLHATEPMRMAKALPLVSVGDVVECRLARLKYAALLPIQTEVGNHSGLLTPAAGTTPPLPVFLDALPALKPTESVIVQIMFQRKGFRHHPTLAGITQARVAPARHSSVDWDAIHEKEARRTRFTATMRITHIRAGTQAPVKDGPWKGAAAGLQAWSRSLGNRFVLRQLRTRRANLRLLRGTYALAHAPVLRIPTRGPSYTDLEMASLLHLGAPGQEPKRLARTHFTPQKPVPAAPVPAKPSLKDIFPEYA